MLNKKVLVAAVIGGLFAGNAAAANLSASPVVPAYYAKEIVATTAAPVTLTTNPSNALSWGIGYNFSANEVKYVRVEVQGNLTFTTVPNVSIAGVGAGAVVGSVNGLGTKVLTFSITAGATPIVAADTITINNGTPKITGTDADITASVALYDQASQAQNGGELGRVGTSVFSGPYITFKPSYELVADDTYTRTADVEAAAGAYTAFLGGGLTETLSTLSLKVKDPDGVGTQTAPFKADGTPIALVDLFDATSKLKLNGNFSALANANGSFTGAALGRAELNGVAATALTATEATFSAINAGFSGYDVDYTSLSPNQIFASDFTASLAPVAASAAYAVTPISDVAAGKIVRNGTELQAPLAQIPGGWISRIALSNTGNMERAYSIKVLSEEGVTLTTANLTGTVPATGTKVIDLTEVLTGATGGSVRGSVIVNVAAPNDSIQGLYQIVNPTGTLSNHVMVRPGSN